MKNTAMAIVALLNDSKREMDANEIFLALNNGGKRYSYAAVYSNIRRLCLSGILKFQHVKAQRQRYFYLNISRLEKTN